MKAGEDRYPWYSLCDFGDMRRVERRISEFWERDSRSGVGDVRVREFSRSWRLRYVTATRCFFLLSCLRICFSCF